MDSGCPNENLPGAKSAAGGLMRNDLFFIGFVVCFAWFYPKRLI